MPSVSQIQAAVFNGFPQGLNRNVDPAKVATEELALATNVRLGPRGEVTLRSGYTKFDVAGLVAATEFVFPFRSAAGVDHLVVVDAAGDVWEDTIDGTFTDSTYNMATPATWQDQGVGFASGFGLLYMSSKTMTSDPLTFDGTTWAPDAGIPKGKSLVYRHGRLFVMNTTARPTGILYSDVNDTNVFEAASYIEVDPDDGYEINAATVYGDDLILLKDNSIWKLAGRTPASFALYRLDNLRGSVAHRGFAQMRGLLYFYDRDSGIWAFDGASLERVSEPINNYLMDNQDYDNGHLVSMYSDEGKLYVSVPWAGATNRMFVLFEDTGGWTEYDGGFNDSVAYLNERYLGLPGANGLFKADAASLLHPPSVTDIEATVRTGWMQLGGPGSKARVRRIEATVECTAANVVTVNMYRDFDPTNVVVTQTFTGGPRHAGSSIDERVVALDGWGDRLHAVQFEFVTDEQTFQLNDLVIMYSGGIDVRGVR